MKDTLKIGDVVLVNSNNYERPEMVIENISLEIASCIWYNHTRGLYERQEFQASSIFKVR